MVLQKTTVAIPLDGALNNKIAEKLLPVGQFLDLQNVVRKKTGQYHKRYGFNSLSFQTIDGESITSGRGLDRFYRDMLLFTKDRLHSYSTSRDRWIDKGSLISISSSSAAVIRNNDQQRYGDVASLSGLEVYVWEDSRDGIRYNLVDSVTGATLIHDSVVSATGRFPRVVALDSCFIITFIDSADSELKTRRISVGTPSLIGAEITIAVDVAPARFYDVERFNDVILVMYNTSTELMLGYITSQGEIGSSGANGYPDPVEVAAAPVPSGAIVSDEEGLRAFVFTGETTAITCYAYGQNLLLLDSDVSVPTPGANGNVTAVLIESGAVRCFYEQESGVESAENRVRQVAVTFNGTSLSATPSAVEIRTVGLVSKAFIVSGRSYVTVAHQSPTQGTYFIVDESGAVVAKMATSKAAGLNYVAEGPTGRRTLSHVAIVDGSYVIPLSVRNRLITLDSTTASGFVGIDRFAFNFDKSNLDSATLGKNLHVAGGVLHMYDGAAAVEHGFYLYPERVVLDGVTGGSLTASKTYRVRVVAEWVDGQGQIHQSAPSAPVSIELGGLETAIEVDVPSLLLTAKQRIKLVAYRTLEDGTTVYYRAGEAFNDTVIEHTTILLTQSDDVIATKEVLYTVGGTLDNIVAPAPVAITTHRNRTFLVSTEDSSVWYSREHVEGEGVAFSDGQRIKFDNGTAVGSLDERIAFFTDSSIFVLSGQGPNDAGEQNDYGPPEEIISDVGCVDARSLIETPIGIMFQSKKGIYLLDLSLTPRYIGDRVENYNHLTVSSAVIIEDDNEVRFTTEEDVCLVYNYFFDQWYTFSNYKALGAVFALDTYCHVTAEGRVNKQIANHYMDNGRRISMVLETNWMQFAKLQGFQRIYRWALLGDFVSHSVCRVKLAYNFESVYNETVYFNTVNGLGAEVYGDGEYGEAVVYGGGNSQVFEFRSKPSRQKCESFKMRIEEVDIISPEGGGSFALTAINLEVGIKGTLNKMSTSKSRGNI